MNTYTSSAAMRAAIDAEPHLLFYAYELVKPDGSLFQIAERQINSLSGGVYYDRDMEIGPIRRTFLDIENKLESPPWVVTFRDPTREFALLVGGPSGAKLQNQTARILMGHDRVARSNWDYRAEGVVRAVEQVAANQWRLTHRFRDEQMSREPVFVFNRSFVPAAAQSGVVGEPPHKLYGKLNSLGLGDNGFVKLQCIDVTAGRFSVAQNTIKEVTTLYTGNPRLPTTLPWVREDIIITGGIGLTTVRFTGTVPTGDVYADVLGYTDNGAVGGNLLVNPVDCMQHFLTGYGGYAGAYHAENAITRAYFFGRGVKTSRIISGHKTGLQHVNEWANSLEIKLSWGCDGRLMFYLFDPGEVVDPDLIARNLDAASHIDILRHAISHDPSNPCEYLHEDANQADILIVDYAINQDGPQANLIVSDPLVGANISKDIQAQWSPSYIVAP